MQIKNIVAVLATVTAINAQVGIEPNATTPNATQPNTTLPTASVTTTVSIGEAVVNTMVAGAFGAAIAAGVAFLF